MPRPGVSRKAIQHVGRLVFYTSLLSGLVITSPTQDSSVIAAKKLVDDGDQLRAKPTAESLKKAIEKYQESIPLWRAANDPAGEVNALNRIGAVHVSLGETQKALDIYDQAVRLAQTAGYPAGEVNALNRIGAVHHSLGETQKALDIYDQALRLAQSAGYGAGEVTALNSLGRISQNAGDYQKALDFYKRARLLARDLGDPLEASMLNNIGTVYYRLGQNEKALDFYNQALVVHRSRGNRRDEAGTLNNIGMVYRSLGENHKALDSYNQALKLALEADDRALKAQAFHNMSPVYRSLGENHKALDYEEQALKLRREAGESGGEASSLTNIGSIYHSLGENRKALESYNQALKLTRKLGDRTGEVLTLTGIARVERDRGNLTEARSQIESALNIVESLRSNVAIQELRASYFASAHQYFEFYIGLLMRLHKLQPLEGFEAAAFEASERVRARSLLELLAEGHADIRQGIDPALLERKRLLQQRLNAKAERQSHRHTEEQAVAAAKELAGVTTELQEVEGEIRVKSPGYAALIQPQPLTLPEIQRSLDSDTLLLEYALGEERSYLWAVTPTSIASYELPKREEIEEAARHVYQTLKKRPAGVVTTDQRWDTAASQLSRILLAPVADQLETKRLLIVADGALQYVPFATLPMAQMSGNMPTELARSALGDDGSPVPLIVHHEIVNLPSASVISVLRRETAGRKPAVKTVAVLADPVFDNEDPRVNTAPRNRVLPRRSNEETRGQRSNTVTPSPDPQLPRPTIANDLELAVRDVTGERGTLSRLPFSLREAEDILATVPAGEWMKAVGFQASRATAMSPELGQYRIIHFATHGLLDSEHPELSGIVLSQVDEEGKEQDGFLRLHEIYNMSLSADLVVLSACETGLGKQIKGEGLVGLTRGFMYAGAPRVVASLWRVDDAATARLMKHFYQGMLGKGLRPAEALRKAQLAMRQRKQWQAPYYWAGFVLQGEWK